MAPHTVRRRPARGFLGPPSLRQPAATMGPRAARTVSRILAAAKEIFLSHGYAGTTIDEIARTAGISRASVYTYFPSKRDVLLALGAESAHAGMEIVGYASEIGRPVRRANIEAFVSRAFTVLDEHASFSFAWTQAAPHDEAIRVAGMRRHLQICRRMGDALGELRGRPFDDPVGQGIVVFSALERSWSYCQLYTGTIKGTAVQRELAHMIRALLSAKAR